MFKIHIDIKQSVLSCLKYTLTPNFTRNYEFHNHFTRQSQSLHTAVGRNEAIYKTFTFHGIRIWNYISTKISVDVSYASFKHSSKLFIKSNPIPYRIT